MNGRRGFTLIELLAVIVVVGVLIGLLLPAVQAAREGSRRLSCQNRLRQIALGATNYQAGVGVYPFGVGGAGFNRWSAQSQLLLYLEQAPLYQALNFSFIPWGHFGFESAINSTALGTKIDLFLCPSDTDQIVEDFGYPLGHNNYRGSAGTLPINLAAGSVKGQGLNNGVFWYQSAVHPARVSDGLSATAFFSERCLGKSGDIQGDYYLTDPPISACANAHPGMPQLWGTVEWSGQRWADGNVFYTRYHHIQTPNRPSCNFGRDDFNGLAVVTASSRHPGGVNVAFGDGSVRFVQNAVDPKIWQALGTIAGREVVNPNGL